MNSVAVIILAAGRGKRMKSDKAKVLHHLMGRPMIMYVLDAAVSVCRDRVIVVVGTQADAVKAVVESRYHVEFAHQPEPLGTGHAVMCALPKISSFIKNIVILCGDVPMIRPDTIRDLVRRHENEKNDVTLLASYADNPKGYGRLILGANGCIERIVEEKDATFLQKSIKMINTGVYCVEKTFLSHALKLVDRNNAQQEIYLTDIVGIAANEKKRVGFGICKDIEETAGINTIDDLARVEALLKSKEGLSV